MHIRVMVTEGVDDTEVFHYRSEHTPAVGDHIMWAGDRMEVTARTWYIDLDNTISPRVWVESVD